TYEYPILAIVRNRLERLPGDGDYCLPLFSGRFGDQLFKPCTEVMDLVTAEERQLVTAVLMTDTKDHTEKISGVVTVRVSTGIGHFFRAVEKDLDVQTHRGRGCQTERG